MIFVKHNQEILLYYHITDPGMLGESTSGGHQLPSIAPGQSNSYPNSTNGNGRYHVNHAYNVAGVSPPQFGNQSMAEGSANRATSAGMHGRVDWKAKYLK